MEGDGEGAPASAVEPKSAVAEEEAAPTTNGDAKVTEPVAEAAKEGAEKEVEERGEETIADEAAEKIEEKAVEKADEDQTMQDVSEPPEAPVEKGVPDNDAKDEAEVGDVSMQTAPEVATAEAA